MFSQHFTYIIGDTVGFKHGPYVTVSLILRKYTYVFIWSSL